MAYWALKAILTPLLWLLYRVRRQGSSQLPRKGPVILAANHRSFIDSIFIPLVVPRRVTFVAKAEYFENKKTAWFFRAVGMIPLKRDGGSASDRALAAARDVLDAGGVLGIYPEGTRSPDGRLYKGHTGVARLSGIATRRLCRSPCPAPSTSSRSVPCGRSCSVGSRSRWASPSAGRVRADTTVSGACGRSRMR